MRHWEEIATVVAGTGVGTVVDRSSVVLSPQINLWKFFFLR